MRRFPVLFFLALILIVVCAIALFKGIEMTSARSQYGEMGGVFGGVIAVLGLTGAVLGGGVMAVCAIADDMRELKDRLAGPFKAKPDSEGMQRPAESAMRPAAAAEHASGFAGDVRSEPTVHVAEHAPGPAARTCPGCDAAVESTSRFCDNCGQKLG